jgi:hypothetical protein
MSRAREIGGVWFDVTRNGKKATERQLLLLAAAENIPLDDLFDEGLTQGQVIIRLRTALGEGVIPPEVIERQRARREEMRHEPECRKCGRVGHSTRHHFTNRWLMLLLENYQAYAARRLCTIPLCVECHRDLHDRRDEQDKSIVPYLKPHEAAFAQKLLTELREQHPKIFDLLAGGTGNVYEARLVQDYLAGEFSKLAASRSAVGEEAGFTEEPVALFQ